MNIVGQVESVWRYPVKSMRGESLPEIFAGFAGVYGDRLFAFKSAAAPAGFPYFTGRERHEMLLYQPRFRHPQRAAAPQNLAEAEALAPGLNLNPVGADAADLAVDVELPSGSVLAIDDPALMRELTKGEAGHHSLTLLRSERAMTDCRPISLISLQTARQLGEEVGVELDSGVSEPMFISISKRRPASRRTRWSATRCALAPTLRWRFLSVTRAAR